MPLCTEKQVRAAVYILTPNTHIICIREVSSQKLGRGLGSGNDAKYRQVHPRESFVFGCSQWRNLGPMHSY